MDDTTTPPSAPHLDDVQRRTLVALFDTLLPPAPSGDDPAPSGDDPAPSGDDPAPSGDDPGPAVPGAGTAGGDRYVEQILGAFDHDPPRIWAGGPASGRHGGSDGFSRFLELSGWEALAWRRRIDGWAEAYRAGLARLGEDFATLDESGRLERIERLDPAFRDLAFEHACESLYGDPVYGGNRDGAAWAAIDFRGDTAPTGWTDDEVTHPHGPGGPTW